MDTGSPPTIIAFDNHKPKIGKDVFIASGARMIGNLSVGDRSSIWFNTVIRADVNWIKIGEGTNIQDNSTVHVTQGTHPTTIGNYVTIGHNALIHGCTIGDTSLIGMGAIIMDGASVGQNSVVAAGSVVTPGKGFPEGSLILGSPAKVIRALEPSEIRELKLSATRYIECASRYL